MKYDTEIPTGDYDVDTPSGTVLTENEELTTADKVAVTVAGILTIVGLVASFVLMYTY